MAMRAKFQIRKITHDDRHQWSEMRTALWPDTPDNHLAEIDEFYNNESPDIVDVFIAEYESQAVVFLELNIRNFAEGSRSTAIPYVEAWYVKPSHQSQGLGKALMQQAEEWALDSGYSELASDTDVFNEKSIEIHKRFGFKEIDRVVCFLKKLNRD